MKKKIRIANCGGFWGDDPTAFERQIKGGKIDYLVMDYLAEITMSILKKQQLKNPDMGYIPDLIDNIKDNIELILKKNIKIISNAGGINPKGLAQKLNESLKSINVNLNIAYIEGDDVSGRIDEFLERGIVLDNIESKEKFEKVKDKIVSANAYLGHSPIVKALENGADIIICGRLTDTSITMAPMIFEFGWKDNDYDKLASGLVAGHIIECGAQATGGNFTDWEAIENWNNFGYPIIEAFPDGSFIVTKHDNTGGIVTVNTVKEQLVYEMGDPRNYISPDVIADFTTINIKQENVNRVKVAPVKGYHPTNFLKVSMAYKDGYKSTGSIMISGDKAIEKAKIFSSAFWERLNIKFVKYNTEFIGFNSCHKDLSTLKDTNEVMLRLSVYDFDKKKVEKFSKMISSLILTGPQGVCVTGGRPRIQEVLTYWPALIPRNTVNTKVTILKNDEILEFNLSDKKVYDEIERVSTSYKSNSNEDVENKKTIKTKLKSICLARSGDKGDTVNIGVIARDEKKYNFLKLVLTSKFIKEKFNSFCKGKVTRYELDNLNALNFLLENSLDGGGTKSLMIDSQGKTFAAALLNIEVECPETIL